MAYYRLYFLNPHTGRIDRFEHYHAEDDMAAACLAADHAGATPLELWSGPRKVRTFAASGEAGEAGANDNPGGGTRSPRDPRPTAAEQ